ncbi:tRNA preQ1(34) S-adenosylmethionine ribosyltransferase-isomerase QueA [bacterium]|nr:tRNA preQ1(34) S-adenosylmethionine ribosyltransferase-isomerase QueA [bacterium]
MRTADFDFELPPELIASQPAAQRDLSRLLVLDRESGRLAHRTFADLTEYVRPGDCLVLNNTRVFPARLVGRLPTGGACEVLLVRRVEDNRWLGLVKPGRKVRPGKVLAIGDGSLEARVLDYAGDSGERIVELVCPDGSDPLAAVERVGHVPLPPYIGREDTPDDRERYQTVYARHSGAVAAPTAGLHFTPRVLEAVRAKGATTAELTLHVGPGTFRPVVVEDIESHRMEAEYYEVTAETLGTIRGTKVDGGRILAVGTTSVRTLETLATRTEALEPGHVGGASGWTDIFIHPGYEFKVVDCLLTNFHLPCSTLIMLVSALAGRETVLASYAEAVSRRYRFYSYGDAMLIV